MSWPIAATLGPFHDLHTPALIPFSLDQTGMASRCGASHGLTAGPRTLIGHAWAGACRRFSSRLLTLASHRRIAKASKGGPERKLVFHGTHLHPLNTITQPL